MTSPVTLKDLAAILGLAPSTVSRALQNHPDISDETKKNVQKMAKELRYSPNILALNLRKQKSNLIAMIVPDVMNYYFSSVIKSVIQHANAKGYNVIVFDSNEKYEEEVEICLSIKKSGIAGVLAAVAKTTRNTDHFKDLKATGIALTFFYRACGDVLANKVITDDFKGAYMAVEYMISGGCRRIAHLSAGQYLLTAQKRQLGYMQALKDHHFSIDEQLIVQCDLGDSIEALTKTLIDKCKVDGIFIVHDQAAVCVLHALQRMNLNVPRDVAVCGFMNEPVSAATTPSLTTVGLDGWSMGKVSVELLLKDLDRDVDSEVETRILKPSLVIRNSTKEVRD